MSICIIIQQWVSCFMHERKNVWTICPADQSLQRYSVLFDSPILCRDCTLWQKENRTVSIPVRRNNSRNRPQSQKRPVPDFTFRGIRFVCKSVWIRIRAHSHDYIGANSYCPSRDFQAWKVAVLKGKEKEKYTTQNVSIYFNCRILEDSDKTGRCFMRFIFITNFYEILMCV